MSNALTSENLQKTLTALNSKYATRVATDAPNHLGLPLGLTYWQTPVWQYLTSNLIVGDKSPLHEVMKLATVIAYETPVSDVVLIHGPTGVGKETFARAFAEKTEAPFVAINTTGLPEYLLESELFGHVAGSFTGATRDKKGLFLEAGRGVLFLDEIGDMPWTLQPKLLRVLEQRTIRPVGSNIEVPINCRVVVATNKNIKNPEVFREDLYWRVSTHVISIKPLVERPMDLMEYIKVNVKDPIHQGNVIDLITRAHYDHKTNQTIKQPRNLPGNYRELKQIISQYRLNNFLQSAGTPPAN